MPIVWATVADDAAAVIAAALRDELGPGEIRTGRLCPVCGGSDHGRPWAEHDGVPVAVSVSRAGEHLLVAVVPGADSVGIDVEEADMVERAWPTTVLAPGERAETVEARLALWVAKEAILKADGVGLAVPMDEVLVADFDGELRALDAPSGFGAAIALRR